MLDFDVPFHLVTWMATAIFDCLPPWLLGPWHLWGVWHHFLLHFIHEMLWCFLMLPCGVVSGVKDRSEQKNSQGRSARPSRALRAPSAGRLEVFALFFFCFFVFLRFFPKHVFSHFFSPPFSVWFFFWAVFFHRDQDFAKIHSRNELKNRKNRKNGRIKECEKCESDRIWWWDERSTQRTCECLRLRGFRYTEVDSCARFGQRSQFSWFELLRTVDFGSTHSPCDSRDETWITWHAQHADLTCLPLLTFNSAN